MMGFVKLACGFTAMFFPTVAGALATTAREQDVQLVVLVVGTCLGLAGMFGFSTVERREG